MEGYELGWECSETKSISGEVRTVEVRTASKSGQL